MKFANKNNMTVLEKEYENAVKLLSTCVPGSDMYDEQLKVVERVHKLLMEEKDRKFHVSPDAVLTAATNLVGMGLIMNFEQLHNITTKAFTMLFKGRLR